MNKPHEYCPHCRAPLSACREDRPACPDCEYIYYDNPVPAVAVLIPMDPRHIGQLPIITETATRMTEKRAIVLVKRGSGKWCLPCGHVNHRADPEAEAVKEVLQETHLSIVLVGLARYINPIPGVANHTVAFYIARAIGGMLQFGDDATGVEIFDVSELPDIEFPAHRQFIEDWVATDLPLIPPRQT